VTFVIATDLLLSRCVW